VIPLIERAGLATAAEIDIDTVEERLRSEVISAGAIIVTPPFVGAWAYNLQRDSWYSKLGSNGKAVTLS
jgi:hypothetical protein